MSFSIKAPIGQALRSVASKQTSLATTTRCFNSSSSRNATKSLDDSTSALDYKMQRRRPPPLPSFSHPRAPSAEEAVTNILYNTPPPSLEPFKRHTLNALVQNEPGVLSRVSGNLAARGFNIDSLVVCQTEIPDLSRMCIVLKGQDGVIEQARRQLEDLVPVWAVLDYTKTSCISRELLLCKVSILGPEYAEQQMTGGPTHSVTSDDIPSIPDLVTADGKTNEDQQLKDKERALAQSFEHSGSLPIGTGASHGGGQQNQQGGHALSQSEALISKNLHLTAIKTLADQFGGRVVDVAENSVIVELTAKTSRVEAFLALMRQFGVLEAARSGTMVMPRTPIGSIIAEEVAEDNGPIDLAMLPPG